jgi:hypothetical protein
MERGGNAEGLYIQKSSICSSLMYRIVFQDRMDKSSIAPSIRSPHTSSTHLPFPSSGNSSQPNKSQNYSPLSSLTYTTTFLLLHVLHANSHNTIATVTLPAQPQPHPVKHLGP